MKYLEDCYKKEFESEIIEVKDKFIVLKETLFYPKSGGQPNDTGKLNDYNVVFVGKFNNQISHEVDKEGLKVGNKVKGTIDWDRRYKLMRSHTAAHIVSNVIHKETGALITGNQLELNKIRIDFSLEEFNKEKFEEYINKANQVMKEGRNVSSMIVSKEEATNILGERFSMLAKGLPESIKEIRIIEIEGFAKEACGGTHVKNTSEVGEMKLLKVENKGKNNRRVYFTL
ncbi:alanyl-tRNA editing protein [archaeon]|jgi:misacylated tRNA(Ala) deacylase|nr:alanyl-tRNA editing protein [archaeon]MBT4396681.1 alanyl-tRNA editing protein [archaeon]MBT4441291.1 alanyl-tRNA editing protein [archaeon]